MKNKKIAIFSPGAGGNAGHGFVYAFNLLKYLKKEFRISFFTINNKKYNHKFEKLDVPLKLSKQYSPDTINKRRFLKFGIFYSLFYGFYRIVYNYKLLKEFYKSHKNYPVFHLFEFEYIALIIFFFTRPKFIKKTILGFHIVDFRWIPERSLSINLYKSILRYLLPPILKKAKFVTLHGETLKTEMINQFSFFRKRNSEKIIPIPYGCNIYNGNKTKVDLRNQLKLEQDKIYGLFFGVLREDKGIIELLNNLNQIENESFRLIIAGSEGDIKKSTLEGLIKEFDLKNKIHLNVKYLTDAELENYFLASDFVFITHKKYHIAYSGPLSLAMEYSLPVLAGNVFQIGYIVKKYGIGELMDTETFNDLSQGVTKIIKGIKEKKYSQEKFNYYYSENTWEAMANKIAKNYSNY